MKKHLYSYIKDWVCAAQLVLYTYLTVPRMGFGMHYWETRFQYKSLGALFAQGCFVLSQWLILANHICPHILHILKELSMKEVRISKAANVYRGKLVVAYWSCYWKYITQWVCTSLRETCSPLSEQFHACNQLPQYPSHLGVPSNELYHTYPVQWQPKQNELAYGHWTRYSH